MPQTPTLDRPEQCAGRPVLDREGTKIGTVEDVYFDRDTKQPEWLLVKTGWFGRQQSFVPLVQVHEQDDALCVPYPKDQVKDAPRAGDDGELSEDEEARLYSHYGLGYSRAASPSGLPEGSPPPRQPRARQGADDAMTRSEEELRVGTVRRPSELVRLKKEVVTEHVQTTVPVQREEIRVEREPITEENIGRAMSGPDITESAHEEVLTEERVVVGKETVPKERVRLAKDVSTSKEQVGAELRKEQIDVERRPASS